MVGHYSWIAEMKKFAAIALAIVATATSSCGINQQSKTGVETTLTQEEDASWFPKDFSKYNNDFAIKWDKVRPYFVTIQVISKKSCGNLYVEMATLGENNINIGYINATTAGLRSREIALLELNSPKLVENYRISKITCY